MELNELQTLADVAQNLATALGILVGGAWALRRYVFNKEALPRLEFQVDVRFVGRQEGRWLVELLGLLENKGQVPHEIRDVRFELRRLARGEVPRDGGAAIHHQVELADVVKEGSWTPADSASTMQILPGVKLRYNHLAQLPGDTSFVLLHGRLTYELGNVDDLRADRLLRVPEEEPVAGRDGPAEPPSRDARAGA